MVDGREWEYIHKWDDNLREIGFTPEDHSLNTMWARGMRATHLMDEEMKKYDDVSSGNEHRTYPVLRALLERKLERKKKRDNLEASRRALVGQGAGKGWSWQRCRCYRT